MKAETVKLPQARHDELFIQQMDEELLVYDAKHFCAHRLNSTAAWVWRYCDGQKSVQDAARLLSDELRQPIDEELVWLSLETLDKAQLLSAPLQRPSGAGDESRRAMIQKLALAGGLMFLLPAITPLTKVARAQTSSPLNLRIEDTAITSWSRKGAGIWAASEGFEAVHAEGAAPGFAAIGAFLTNPDGTGPALHAENKGKGGGIMAKAKSGAGIWAASDEFEAVHADTKAPGFAAVGAFVTNAQGTGPAVHAENQGKGTGVTAKAKSGAGIWATSDEFEAVHAETKSPRFSAVSGFNNSPAGGAASIHAENKGAGPSLTAKANTGAGIWATSEGFEAVHAETKSPKFGAVSGFVTNPNGTGAAIYGENQGKGPAGLFRGNVEVTGDIRLLNADCAEDFDIRGAETVEAGTVMVLCDEGALEQSQKAYDKRVAGVISGAGNFKPGLILDTKPTGRTRQPVALMGKVFCKADARYGAIEAGDLLTTSDTPGHVMKAADPMQSFGAVVGKALRGLPEGQDLIPILVTLQ